MQLPVSHWSLAGSLWGLLLYCQAPLRRCPAVSKLWQSVCLNGGIAFRGGSNGGDDCTTKPRARVAGFCVFFPGPVGRKPQQLAMQAAWHGCLHRPQPPGQRHIDAWFMHLQHKRSRPGSKSRQRQCVKPSAALVGAAGAQDWGLWALLAGCGACGQVRELAATCAPLPVLMHCRHGCRHCCMLCLAVSASQISCIASMAVGGTVLLIGFPLHPGLPLLQQTPPLQPASPESELLLAHYNQSCTMSPSFHADLGAAHHCRRTPVRSTALHDGRPSAGYSRCVAHCQPSLWHYFHAPYAPWSGPVPSRV